MDTNRPPASYRTSQHGRRAYPAHLARDVGGPLVPLHRRGTSQKYECLEDLLREAGFKETRVFTPEAERTEAAADARRKQADRARGGNGNGVDTGRNFGFFEFLTGLVSRNDEEGGARKVDGRYAKAQSLGRAAGKQNQISLSGDEERPKTAENYSDPLVTPIILASDFSSPGSSSSSSSRSAPRLRFHSSQAATNGCNGKQVDYTRLDARSTLRHMISLPEFESTQQISRRTFLRHASEKPRAADAHRVTQTRQFEEGRRVKADTESAPPLPRNWFSTVTHAVMSASGTGARVGRPHQTLWARKDADSRLEHHPTRTDVQGSFEYTRRDGSLARRGFAPLTPRTDATPAVITAASVVCRSAPGSRSSSLVRKPSTDNRAHQRRRCGPADTCMPCLGNTSVQLPGLAGPQTESESSEAPSDNETAHGPADDAEESYDDSSDEGELDFERLILPARRQHSIQSLRCHLHNHTVACAASGGSKAPPSAFNRALKRAVSRSSIGIRNTLRSRTDALDDPDEFLNGRRVSPDEDTENELLADWAAHGLPGLQNTVHKRRGALPWTNKLQGN